MPCSRCGAEPPETAMFCPRCGANLQAPLQTDCPRCGRSTSSSNGYCPNCGAPLHRQGATNLASAGGVLSIVAACMCAAMGGIGFTIDPFRDESKYFIMGVAGSVAFVLGLIAGILILRRALLPLVILGLFSMALAPYFTLFEEQVFMILGLPPLILGITALAFVAASHREFNRGTRF